MNYIAYQGFIAIHSYFMLFHIHPWVVQLGLFLQACVVEGFPVCENLCKVVWCSLRTRRRSKTFTRRSTVWIPNALWISRFPQAAPVLLTQMMCKHVFLPETGCLRLASLNPTSKQKRCPAMSSPERNTKKRLPREPYEKPSWKLFLRSLKIKTNLPWRLLTRSLNCPPTIRGFSLEQACPPSISQSDYDNWI